MNKNRKIDEYDMDIILMEGYIYGEHRNEDLNSMSYDELEKIWREELGYDEDAF